LPLDVFRALQIIDDLATDLEIIEECEAQRKLLKTLREFEHYPLYRGEPAVHSELRDRYRNGENIVMGFVELTIIRS
jgi:hypothetical protein